MSVSAAEHWQGLDPTRPIRVLIADDHAATRAGVRESVQDGGFEVCAEAANAQDAIDLALSERPDV